jgi:hypothetical protein
LFVYKATPVMPGSAKNASGQEAFGHKGKEVSVEQLPTTSTADVSSQVLRARETAAPEAGKGGASGAPPVGGHQDDLCMSAPLPALDQQTVEVGGPSLEGDNDRCLYVGTPWENDVITDRRDVDDFK